MAEKSAKKKSKKAAKTEDSVLGNLSASRPTRLGGERRTGARGVNAATTASAAKTSAAARPKAATTTARPTTSGAKAKTSTPKAADAKAATRRKPAPAPPAGRQAPGDEGRREGGPPRGAEIVTTAVQAAGELAQIGVTFGGQLLKRAAGRIPRR
jgi:hypothetical protein